MGSGVFDEIADPLVPMRSEAVYEYANADGVDRGRGGAPPVKRTRSAEWGRPSAWKSTSIRVMLRILGVRLRLLDGGRCFFNAFQSRGRRLALIFYGASGVIQRCYLVLLAITDGAER